MSADKVNDIATELYGWIREKRHRSEIVAMGLIAAIALIGVAALWVGGAYAVFWLATSNSPGFLEAIGAIIAMLAITFVTISVVRPVVKVMEWVVDRIGQYYGKSLSKCKEIPDKVAQEIMSVEEAGDQLLAIAKQHQRR